MSTHFVVTYVVVGAVVALVITGLERQYVRYTPAPPPPPVTQ